VTAGMLVGEPWLASCIVIGEDASTHWADDLRHRVDELIDEFRASLHDCLEGLLRELAQHAGHADILREQILARRAI
jgi:Protein of unknown function (DUF664)